MILLELFLGFLKVGCFAFGGAYGAIPLIRDVVLSAGWLTEDALTRMIAVSESTPGPIMVNLATYVGSSQAGLPGALAATLAVVLPSFCIILLVLVVLGNLFRHPVVKAMLAGMQPCVVGIILATGICLTWEALASSEKGDLRSLLIALILGGWIIAGRRKGKAPSAISLIGISGILGVLFYGI